MVPPVLGNALPAFTRQRVFVGHHFLTPDFAARANHQRRLLNEPGREAELRALVDAQRISRLVVSASHADRLARAFGPRLRSRTRHGQAVVLEIALPADAGDTRDTGGRK